MTEEIKISFSANGTGVILHTQYGDLHYSSEEYNYYDLIFKITDYLNEGGLSVNSSQLLSLLARTNVPWSSLEKAIQITVASNLSEETHSEKSVVEEEWQSKVLHFPHFLILAKLLAYYQEKNHLPSKKTLLSIDPTSPPVKSWLNFQLGQLVVFPPQFHGIQHQFSAKVIGHQVYPGENFVNSYVKYSIECTARPFGSVEGQVIAGGGESGGNSIEASKPKSKKKVKQASPHGKPPKMESKFLLRWMRDAALVTLPPPFPPSTTPDSTTYPTAYLIERRYNEFAQFHERILSKFYGLHCLPPLPDKHSVTWLTFLQTVLSSSLTSSLSSLFPATSSPSTSSSSTSSSPPSTSFVHGKDVHHLSEDSTGNANGNGHTNNNTNTSSTGLPSGQQIVQQRLVEFQLLLSYILQHPFLCYCFELRMFLLLQTTSQLQAFFQLYDLYILPNGQIRVPVLPSPVALVTLPATEEKDKKGDLLRQWYTQGSQQVTSLFHSVNENLTSFMTSHVFLPLTTKPYPKLQPGLTLEGKAIGATKAEDIHTIQSMQSFYVAWQNVVNKVINCFVLASMSSSEREQLSLAWKEFARSDTTLFSPFQHIITQFGHTMQQQVQKEIHLLEVMSLQVLLPIQYHGKFVTSYEKLLQRKSQLQKELWDCYVQECEMREFIQLVQSKYHLVSVKAPSAHTNVGGLLVSGADMVEEEEEGEEEEKEEVSVDADDEEEEEEMVMIELVECEDFLSNQPTKVEVENDMIMTQSLHLSQQADTQKDLQAMKLTLMSYENAYEKKRMEESWFVKNLSFESARLKALHHQQLLVSNLQIDRMFVD